MKLIAMMVVRNEADRYLRPCIEHLLDFCDEIRVVDDNSSDHTQELLASYDGVEVMAQGESTFYQHEGRTRQALLEWTMEGRPTHILAIDADEFIADGKLLRATMEKGSATGVWKLTMTEVWAAGSDWLSVRMDGDWKPRPIGIAFAVPADHWTNRQLRRHWRMHDRALACGRTPLYITMAGNRTVSDPVTDILHFGWACVADRQERYQRYVVHDGGAHHASKHLLSIMWPDEMVGTKLMAWPPALDKELLAARANRA
jgi:hypothetical protein